MSYNAVFNNNNLGGGSYKITKIELPLPEIKLNRAELAQGDGQIVTNRLFGEREVVIAGYIEALSLSDLQTKLDTLKTYLTAYNKNLDITYGGTERRYLASVKNFVYTTNGFLCQFTITFTASALGYDVSSSSLTFGTFTVSPTSYDNTIGGTYKSGGDLELLVNFTNNWWASKYIQLYNASTNQRLRFTKKWVIGDKLVINSTEKSVYLYNSTNTTIDACDAITGWTTTTHTLSLDSANMLEGAGALKVVMGSATATMDFIRLNAGAVDLSATAGKILVPIFIPTPTSGTVASVDFYTGSDATLASNYSYWRVSTQWDGSAIASNAWNYFVFDLGAGATGTTGTPTRTAIKSIKIVLNATATMQLNGALLDIVTLYKPSIIPTVADYEGIFIDYEVGTTTITVSDEFTSRNITITGTYYKRYL